MNREEMIEILVNYHVQDCRGAGFTDFFESCLYSGFQGYENYTDQDVKDEFEELDAEEINSVLDIMKQEESEEQNPIKHTLPF